MIAELRKTRKMSTEGQIGAMTSGDVELMDAMPDLIDLGLF